MTEQKQSPDVKVEERLPNFVLELVEQEVAAGKNGRRVMTRFPPEPNGYLHIGHAKSICLNFGIAERFPGAVCNLRFDDTNPSTEEGEFVRSIQEDVRWLGFDWESRMYFASDYFEQLYDFALRLIDAGKAYVDSQTVDEMRQGRGGFYTPGRVSPYRDRSIAENRDLLQRMRAGEFADGAHVLRAKIDMQASNQNMRDPVMYRIKREHHHRTGDTWCLYPMYDFAHGYSDAIEGVTHSVCTLEFENHRPLYDWFLDQIPFDTRPRQIEFARLNLTYTVLSKRKLQVLVQRGHVSGWNDPRMPTLAGLKRRGYTPEAIRAFCDRIGVSKRNSFVDVTLLEHAVREDLNARCRRALGVLRPLRVVIENYPDGKQESFEAPWHPEDATQGGRALPFSNVVYVDRDDFAESPPKGWFRLSPGAEVRLRYACIIKCERAIKNGDGEVIELRCTWDPSSRGGNAADGRKVKGTLHWVSEAHSIPAEVRLYDRLFRAEHPGEEGDDFLADLNPESCEILQGARVEPALALARSGDRFQFERVGYFCVDLDSKADGLVFNRTIGLRDSWAAKQGK
ncbi:MAG TPA: glutamine--tRNA ligase/YqeY domain fusion protein [Polyangiaceae bacterium]|jgi:glutaminyl-tRNA synthetase|nr:glutamine--tRNA ligase/YqeY domain fusion protein [Polyangiaceae bacterium]